MPLFRRVPSVKTLHPVFGDRSQEARDLLKEDRNPEDYKSVKQWIKQCHHKPRKTELLMEALNEVAGTCGVEPIWLEDDITWPTFDYLNTGDSYATTLIFNRVDMTVQVTSVGDLMETGRYKTKE